MTGCIVLLSGKGQIRLPPVLTLAFSSQAIAGQDGHGGHYVDIDLYGFSSLNISIYIYIYHHIHIIIYIYIYQYTYIYIYTMNHH